jgi:methylglutamate dehydrogenase subunit D
MVEPLSPLGDAYRPGRHGSGAGAPGVTIAETRPGSIVQLAAWPGTEAALAEAVSAVAGLSLPQAPGAGTAEEFRSVFGIAPRRWLLVDQAEGLAPRMSAAITADTGTVTDLSHGRTAIRIEGERAEWVLAKLFAIDFAQAAFPVGHGRSTVHHDIFAAIQRTGANRFDLYVFRSFARAFWTTLCHAAEETDYVVR